MKNFKVGDIVKYTTETFNNCTCFLCNNFLGIVVNQNKKTKILFIFIPSLNKIQDIDLDCYSEKLNIITKWTNFILYLS